uniref:Ig-like domain-containing protein n=1 Tax=Chelydra serpentina TaxID=8475 RepID=A0A8C3RTX1_CHESE
MCDCIVISLEPTPRRQVNGILGGSVVLSVDLSPGKKVKEIEWSFSAGTGVTIQLAEFSEGKFERMDPGDRFQQRLEMYNETSLRIKALELGDSGVYGARIKIVPATVEDRAFLLMVYEPVPAPEIESHSLSHTADGCNVSLQCQASGREEVNVSWTRGNPPRELGSSERYQLAPDGRTLRLSLQPSPPDSTFTCTASNSVSQKNISLDLQSMCQSGGEGFTACPNLAWGSSAGQRAGDPSSHAQPARLRRRVLGTLPCPVFSWSASSWATRHVFLICRHRHSHVDGASLQCADRHHSSLCRDVAVDEKDERASRPR